MATVDKNFRIKHGLVVEGSTATVNGNTVLTENAGDQYILDLIGGETLVKSVESTQLEVDGNGKLSVKSNVFDAYGAASTAETNANTYTTNAINALSTSDIEEGSNLYYTAARAKAEAATLLANATKTNIVITKDGSNNLTITAENGVADSTTDDLSEGSTNKYFTDERAQDAIGNNLGTGLAYNDSTGAVSINRTTVDTWYDASGSAAAAQSAAEGYTDSEIGALTTDDIE